MDDTRPTPEQLSQAVARASEHFRQQQLEAEEATRQAKEPPSKGRLAVVLVLLVAVLTWNVVMLLRPAALPPPAEEAVDLRYMVVEAVEVIEDFQTDAGRLPSRTELVDLIDEEISYEVVGDGYVVGLDGERVRVEFDSSLSLDEWLDSGPFETIAGGRP